MGAASSSFPGVTPVPGGEIACRITGAFKSAREFRIVVVFTPSFGRNQTYLRGGRFFEPLAEFFVSFRSLPRKMQARGLHFGSVDPCHPSRVVQGRFDPIAPT
jgi:hypothetical protein